MSGSIFPPRQYKIGDRIKPEDFETYIGNVIPWEDLERYRGKAVVVLTDKPIGEPWVVAKVLGQSANDVLLSFGINSANISRQEYKRWYCREYKLPTPYVRTEIRKHGPDNNI